MDTEEVKELEDQVESLEFCWEKSLERNTFLQEELKLCYREMEQYEKKIEQLENQKMDLVEDLAKKNLARHEEAGFSTEADKEI